MKWGRTKSAVPCSELIIKEAKFQGIARIDVLFCSSSSSVGNVVVVVVEAGWHETHSSDVTCTSGFTLPSVGAERVPSKPTTLPGFKRKPSAWNEGPATNSTVNLLSQK